MQPMEPPPIKKRGLVFTMGKPKAPEIMPQTDISGEVNSLGRRIRVLEERYTNLRTKSSVTEQNMLSRNKSIVTETKTINSDVHDIKVEIAEIKDTLVMLMKELQNLAKKDEVMVLQKYINLWDPTKFVTQNEVEDIVKEIIEKDKDKS